MMLFVVSLLAINVASLGYVFRRDIARYMTRTIYVYDIPTETEYPGATSRQDHSRQVELGARMCVYREILQASGLDDLRCDVGASMLSKQDTNTRGLLLTTGLRVFVAQLKKTSDDKLEAYQC